MLVLSPADYPTPNITHFGNPSADIRRIMCFTSGGFPKPTLSWLVNGKELSGINTTISQDPESELYTVSSQLDFNMTYNHSIVCHVAYGDSQVSKNYTWEKRKQHYPGKCLLYSIQKNNPASFILELNSLTLMVTLVRVDIQGVSL